MSALEQKVSIYFQFAFFAPAIKEFLDDNPMLKGEACFFTALSAVLNHRPASFASNRTLPILFDQNVLDKLKSCSQDCDPVVKAVDDFREYVNGRRLSTDRQYQYDGGYWFLLRCTSCVIYDILRETKAQARRCP